MGRARVPAASELSISVDIDARFGHRPAWLPLPSNVSLLWHRFLPAHDKVDNPSAATTLGVDFVQDWSRATGKKRDERAVKELAAAWHGYGVLKWFAAMADEVVDPALAEQAHSRRRAIFDATGVRQWQVHSFWRAAVGLGNPAAVENSGATIHRFYGFPVLPAASLKGVTRHFLVEEVDAALSTDEPPLVGDARIDWRALLNSVHVPNWTRPHDPAVVASFLFGGTDASSGEGIIAFYDGWAVGSGCFEPDVLTSHHQAYYTGTGRVASDSDEPNPVHFLTVRPSVAFELGLGVTESARGLTDEQRGTALDAAQRLVTEAIARWGIGGKTGAGYGRMVLPPRTAAVRHP